MCVIDLERVAPDEAVRVVIQWLDDCAALGRPFRVLNVAGMRESKAPGIQRTVEMVMREVLSTHGERTVAPEETDSQVFDRL